MRIGIVTGEYPPMVGGVGAYSQIMAHELTRQGHHVSVFSNRAAQNTDQAISLYNTVDKWGFSSLHALQVWTEVEQLDIVNLQFQTAAFGMSPWIHFLPDILRSVPVVTTFHDLRYPYLFPKAEQLRDWIVMHLAKRSDGVIVTNHEDQLKLKHLSKVTLIPIGSNILKNLPAHFDRQAWREKAGAQDDEFLLAYFGLFNRSKGLETLLVSFAKLRKEGVPARLLMMGGGAGASDPTNATFMDEVNQQIKRLGLVIFVQQTGYLDDTAVGAYLTASDAVVLPFADGASYRRGSLMAAIRYGCAIITTTPSISIPTFQNGDNMLLVKPGDIDALMDAIRELCQSSKLREQLQKGALELAPIFEWSEIAQATTDYYRWIIEEKPST
jgi:glycosyltransferase involved in cell wall biosynthesis